VIELKSGTRIWIAAGFTDLRRGFQGLADVAFPLWAPRLTLCQSIVGGAREDNYSGGDTSRSMIGTSVDTREPGVLLSKGEHI
jgi:hypothetical protein